ncbi:MAG: hypothetical protein KKH98_12935 [Spirochaetes bacterium]|nr:hypothetical protein [Spirochaetota bacterium]
MNDPKIETMISLLEMQIKPIEPFELTTKESRIINDIIRHFLIYDDHKKLYDNILYAIEKDDKLRVRIEQLFLYFYLNYNGI